MPKNHNHIPQILEHKPRSEHISLSGTGRVLNTGWAL